MGPILQTIVVTACVTSVANLIVQRVAEGWVRRRGRADWHRDRRYDTYVRAIRYLAGMKEDAPWDPDEAGALGMELALFDLAAAVQFLNTVESRTGDTYPEELKKFTDLAQQGVGIMRTRIDAERRELLRKFWERDREEGGSSSPKTVGTV
ncbi:hypothetical protein AAEX63_15660 [Luteococcus sp. H138]|uniref:hypothetical protein n=1 Tax=unclassified Luteococcus TaxID=2639923 RepID=UPI00313F1B10